MKSAPFRVLVVAGLADNMLDCFVSQIVSSEEISATILRSKPGLPRERVTYLCPPNTLQRVPILTSIWKLYYSVRLGLKADFSSVCAIFTMPHLYLAAFISFLARKPLFYTVIASDWELKGVGPVLQKLTDKLALGASKVIVSGERAIEHLTTQGIQLKDIIKYSITELVNLDEFFPLEIEKTMDLIVLSRLVDGKNIETFIDIVAAIKETTPNIKAAIIGDGYLRNDLERYAMSLNLSESIKFYGYVSSEGDVNRILNSAKIFVFNSSHEGGPFTIPEAMAAGLCVVSSDVGEVSSIIDHGYNGYIVARYDDIDSYISIINQLLNDKSQLERVQQRAAEIKERGKQNALAIFWQGVARSFQRS
ncbi:MAG: glycosyltransferase family 4 protein [Candidatus Sifarchaeia archaeon]